MKYVWEEVGWYDCCGGGWFVVYNLIQQGDEMFNDIPAQEGSLEEVYARTILFERMKETPEDSLEYNSFMDNDKYFEVLSIVVDMVSLMGVEVAQEMLECEVEIIEDKSIDWEESWTCQDD